MLFEVRLAAMDDDTEIILNALDAIVARVEDDVHELEIPEADELESTIWYQSSRRDRQKMLQGLAETSLHRKPRTRGPHLRRVEVSDATTAAQARSLAYAPLLVLVENDISDGALVKAALRVLGGHATLDLLFGAPSRLEPPAVAIDSRGGHGNLPTLIDTRLTEAAERGRPARLVVVTDSDGEWPEEVKDHALKIRRQCALANLSCPPLNKRTVENYIPDGVWSAWVAVPANRGAKLAVDALLRLSPDQRDHVKMDHPQTNPWDATSPRVAALFLNVSTADHDVLREANLKGRGQNMRILALDVYQSALTRMDLQARDQHGDLLALVQCIEDEL